MILMQQLKCFCSAKKNIIEEEAWGMEKIFVKYTSDRGLMCRINKELEKQITRKINSPIKKAGV